MNILHYIEDGKLKKLVGSAGIIAYRIEQNNWEQWTLYYSDGRIADEKSKNRNQRS